MRVRFEDVTVALGGRDVVREASLVVEPGTVVGLVGPNGSGKSSLLRTLYRAVRPRRGAVYVDGQDVQRLSGRQAARAVAVMLQDPSTDFDLSVEETVMLGRVPHHASFGRDTAADEDVVADAMRRAGITELADRMVATLSGGQRQRVMLARALAQQSPVMVLDEPSNHLDISHQHELLSTVRGLGRTTIAALHDLNLAARYCDHVVVLQAGCVIAAGPPRQVFTPELIRATFRVDVRVLGDAHDPVFAFRRLDTADPSPVPSSTDDRAESSTPS
ncbi:iron complex transport system ATP-binding protein [Actinoalloteichus hoggarensis]|uniref:Putative siderophore transport system ATP-binding protein YusV n=1 Tax=Actinoalloteichus hoggarensis TaxID=1470176 RepID=A0A221W4S1_9PSEU|nr:ABC transporter ATP-binding protein [Actinoalloteichus hoggarensis]ASO20579.1 putative siderophore transport system ATP-binding protein YusV [Actinoalloteichus hoggarensis]MBB5923620.1 iron complex transport system ATP-binding protein [Actinoalloteichus hoggarensis]